MVIFEDDASGYDIIGDVHGCYTALCELLERLGYTRAQGDVRDYYRHSNGRKVMFLGDLIDRGPHIRETVLLVRSMMDAGHAHAVLGNHEYNAICLEDRNIVSEMPVDISRKQATLNSTLQQFEPHVMDWDECLAWFRTLPICLEMEAFRAVHACWDRERVTDLRGTNPALNFACDTFLHRSATQLGSTENRIVERLLKGTELCLPEGYFIEGRDGIKRQRFRTKFWHPDPQTYSDVIFQPDGLPEPLVEQALSSEEREQLVHYAHHEKPLFIGHYWRQGKPDVLNDNIACLDYSAVRNGRLCAYRMDAERKLDSAKLVSVAMK